MDFSRTSSWCNAELSLGPAVGDVYEAALVRTAADAALQEVVVSVTGSVQSWQTCTCAGDLLYPADFTFDTSGVSGGIWTVEYWCDACPGLSSRRESHRLKLKFRQL